MNILYDINMDEMGMEMTGMKKGVMWMLHKNNDTECPHECVRDCDNVSGRNVTKNGVFGTVSRVRADTSNCVFFLRKRKIMGGKELC